MIPKVISVSSRLCNAFEPEDLEIITDVLMRPIVTLVSIFFFAPLLGKQLLLDEVMNKEDQRKTGVAYLTPNQRSALETWINQNCNCTPQKTPPQPNLFLSININNGQKIQLTDGTIWEINPQNYATSAAWLASIPIKIVPSDDPDFPYLLVNKNDGVSVKAKKAEMMPQAPAFQPSEPTVPSPTQPAPRSPPSTPPPQAKPQNP